MTKDDVNARMTDDELNALSSLFAAMRREVIACELSRADTGQRYADALRVILVENAIGLPTPSMWTEEQGGMPPIEAWFFNAVSDQVRIEANEQLEKTPKPRRRRSRIGIENAHAKALGKAWFPETR